jgi:DNA repair protein RecN (Recombination protein N)
MLNGSLTTVGTLVQCIGPLIELHGQHEHQALLSAARHLAYLDRWAQARIAEPLARYRSAFAAWQKLRALRTVTEDMLSRGQEELEAGRRALAEIAQVDPQPGEDDELRRRLPALENAGQLAEALDRALEALRGEAAADESLYTAIAALDAASSFDERLQDSRLVLENLRATLLGVIDELRDYAAAIEHDPAVLAQSFERLAALEGLMKRFGPTLDAVRATRERLTQLTDMQESGADKLKDAHRAEEQARAQLDSAARALSVVRHKAADDFIAALAHAAADLEMGKVRFEFAFSELSFEQWTETGSERGAILYAPTPQVACRPLAKIASGGEISRVMLAAKSVLGRADTAAILIFDEIDAGIGGAVATAVGRKLASLATSHQVIVVTHLAQVAVFADAHFLVRKTDESVVVGTDGAGTDRSIRTTVEALTGAARIDEIARLLSGSVTDTARKHATELCAAARRSSC